MLKQLGHYCLACACLWSNLAHANPEGAVIVAGQANIAQDVNTLTVTQSTPNAIVNWDRFNIQPGEHARFVQPEGGIILNRINANNGASQIQGQLSATGTLVLVNQAGILFSKDAQVDIGKIIASTADITNDNFMQNKFIFDQPGLPGSYVTNLGRITAKENGLVALLGQNLRSDGLINAKAGKVILAKGSEVAIDLNGDDLISFGIANPHENFEQMTNQGNIVLTANVAQEVLDQAINVAGIESTSVIQQDGNIIFTGEIKTEQGTAVILSDTVIVDDKAKIDVSGENGGGTILIGGDFQGSNPKLINAKRTYVGKDTELKADAINSGNGGKVIIWADDTTKFFGNVSAKGGEQNGNGGFVEISGKQNLEFSPASPIYTTAANGTTGQLLLDPAFLTVVTASGSAYSAGVNNLFANNPSGTNLITPASIVTAAVGADIVLQANTDVTFTNSLALTTAGRSLTVQAGRSVLINAAVSTTNGAISISANDTGATSANRAAGNGAITMVGSTLSSGTASLSLTIGTSNVAPFSPGNITALGLTGGAVSLSTPNALTATTIAQSVSLNIDVGASSSVSGIISGNGAITKIGSGLVDFTAANTYLGATNVNVGTMRASNAAAFGNTAGGVTVASGASIEINGVAITTEAFTLNGAGVGGLGALIGTGTCSHSGIVTLASDTTFGGTGTFTQSGIVSGSFNILKAGTGTLIFSGANTYNGITEVSAGTLTASNATALGVVAPAVLVDSGATLEINGVAIGAKPLNISGTGASSTGALLGTGTSSYAGTVTMLANTTIGGAGTFTISGAISGNFNLTKIGSGSISLSGINSNSGTIAVNAGTLRASNASALGSTATSITVASGATLDINAVAVGTKPLTISGTGVGAVGALTGTGTGSYAGTITMVGDTTIGGTGTTTLSGIISGNFNLTKIGTGIMIFSNGANSYLATTNVNAGTLRISSDGNLGLPPGSPTASSIVLGGGTLNATAAFTLNSNRGIFLTSATTSTIQSDVSSLIYNGIIDGSGNLVKTGAGIFALGGVNTYSGSTTINAGILSLTIANAIANSNAVTLANVAAAGLQLNTNNQNINNLSGGGTTGGTINLGSATLSVNQTAAGTYAGVMSGTGNLTLTNTSNNTLTLSNASNSYSGITTINGGSISISADTNLGTTPGVVTLGKLALNAGTLIANANFTLSANRGIAISGTGGTIQVNPGFTLTYNGIIAGSADFTKSGTGTLSTNAVQNYSGATNINDGTLSLNAANLLVNSSGVSLVDTAAATLSLNGFDQTLNNFSGGGINGGTVLLGTGNLTINQTVDNTFAGEFGGTGNITMSNISNKTLTLSNSSSAFSGNFNLNGGTLAINSDSNLGSVPVSATAGKINFNGGTLQSTNTITLDPNRGIAILVGGATINVNPSTTLTYNGILAGSGAGGPLNKTGTGILSLGGNSTFNGAVNITTGIISLTSANSLGNASSTTVTNGAELDLNFNSATLANTNTIILNGTGVSNAGALSFSGSFITVNNPLTIASSTTIGGVGAGSMTLGGTITSSSALSFNLATGAIVLPTINMNNAGLSVAAGTSISQSGPITLTGSATASFAGNTANTDITLDQANNFGSNAATFTGTLSNIRDLYFRNTNAAARVPSFSGLSNLRNLTLVFNAAGITIPAVTLTNSGALSVTAGGSILQSGIITVPGTSSFTAGANPITLSGNNLFSGAVTFSNSGANDVSVNNATNLTLASSTVGQNFAATATGLITQNGALTIPGTANFNAGANQINLLSNNQISGAVSISNTGNNIIFFKNILPTVLGNISAGQDLTISSGGNITQNGTNTITATNGNTFLAANVSNADITLSNANDFGTSAPVFAGTRSNIRDVYLRNINTAAAVPSFTGLTSLRNLTLEFNNSAMSIPAVTLNNSGVLVATAGGAITQTGAAIVPGTATFTAGANPITLSQSNQFVGVVTLSSSGNNDVTINNNTALILNGTTLGRRFTASAVGGISQTGAITVPGRANFTAPNGPITLSSNNIFTGELSLINSGSNDITVNNAIATVLGTVTVGRNFTLSSGATISQSFPITATAGTCTFSVTAPTSSILLTENNDFGTFAPLFTGTTSNITNLDVTNINSAGATPVLSSLSNLHFLELNYPNTTIALSSLSMNGTAILTANNATGTLAVHGLQLDTNFCNLFGFVNGASGQDAIDQIVLLNTITAGTHFFDGIDMYGSTPPTPPTPPTPTSSVKIPFTTIETSIIANQLFIAGNYWDSIQTRDVEATYYDMVDQEINGTNEKQCATYGSDIEVCF